MLYNGTSRIKGLSLIPTEEIKNNFVINKTYFSEGENVFNKC